jgi:hypothetical protein
MGPAWLDRDEPERPERFGDPEPLEIGDGRAQGPMYIRAGGAPQRVNESISSIQKELAVMAMDLQGLDGDLRGLIDLLRPYFGPERPVLSTPDLQERGSEGRSEVAVTVVALSNQVRTLRGLLQGVGAALEL